tara:strand:+ start:1083 stop:1670 length:588 start_codon:yes stop_codon:yes gene_type:complete
MKSKKMCFSKELFYLGCIVLALTGYLIIDKLSIYYGKEELIKKEDCNCPTISTKPVKVEKEDRLVIVDRPVELDSPPQYKRGPERNYTMGGGLPINIRTRGEPNAYQNIGLLKNISESNDVKPLYGRRIYRGSNMWNYYTVLNDHIQVKLPIMRTNNCLDERGCSEIQSGEEITVNNKKYITELYPYSDFRYIPY